MIEYEQTEQEAPKQRVIRDKEFAKRIEIACENHHHSPSGHGRQKWVRERVMEMFGVKLSAEAVRKWFAGESRPRPKVMSQVARVLEVDEAWLSLGITPNATPRERSKQNAIASGAVNLVAAHIQLAGGNIAFPETETDEHDLFAIVRGKRHAVTVRMGARESAFRMSVYRETDKQTIIAVVPTSIPTIYQFLRVPNELAERCGKRRGGFVELAVDWTDDQFAIEGERLPVIKTFERLEG